MKKYMIATVAALLLTGVSMPTMATAAPSNGPMNLVDQQQVKPIKKKKKKAKKIENTAPTVSRAVTTNTQRPVQSRPVVANNQRPSQPKSSVAKVTKAAVPPPPPPRCQFLFWDYECTAEEKREQEMSRSVADTGRPVHIKKAEKMIGMTARKNDDRKQLKQYFASNLSHSIDPARIPWCAAWANAVLAEAGYNTTDSLMARSFLHYGKVIREPRKGDIVVLRRGRSEYTGHVGFFIERVTIDGKTYVAVLGGNQSKSVNVAYYREDRVIGYREPVPA